MKPQRGVILIAATVTLASCSSGSSNPATTRPSTSAATAAAAPGTSMTVTESESKISNKGKFAHNLTVDGAGVQDKATPTIALGSTGDLTVTLQKGSYEFYCSVDSHKDMGMDLTVQGDMTQRPVTH
jgi:plastocyanin